MTLFAIDNSNWKSMHPAFLSPQRQTLQLRKRTHKQRLIQLLANYDQPAKAFCTCLWPPDVLKSAPIVVESVVCANLHVMSRENFVQQEKRPSTKPSPAKSTINMNKANVQHPEQSKCLKSLGLFPFGFHLPIHFQRVIVILVSSLVPPFFHLLLRGW